MKGRRWIRGRVFRYQEQEITMLGASRRAALILSCVVWRPHPREPLSAARQTPYSTLYDAALYSLGALHHINHMGFTRQRAPGAYQAETLKVDEPHVVVLLGIRGARAPAPKASARRMNEFAYGARLLRTPAYDFRVPRYPVWIRPTRWMWRAKIACSERCVTPREYVQTQLIHSSVMVVAREKFVAIELYHVPIARAAS
ncbi:hypothetical protein PSPO01_11643 [Paraphaeosphaeria sporulosa]